VTNWAALARWVITAALAGLAAASAYYDTPFIPIAMAVLGVAGTHAVGSNDAVTPDPLKSVKPGA
jgi:hypothetical protein